MEHYSGILAPCKGHFGTSHFAQCIERLHDLFSKVYCKYTFGDMRSVLCRDIVPFLDGPLLEVPLYIKTFSTYDYKIT